MTGCGVRTRDDSVDATHGVAHVRDSSIVSMRRTNHTSMLAFLGRVCGSIRCTKTAAPLPLSLFLPVLMALYSLDLETCYICTHDVSAVLASFVITKIISEHWNAFVNKLGAYFQTLFLIDPIIGSRGDLEDITWVSFQGSNVVHAGIAQVRVQNSRPSVVVVLILPTTQATFDAHYDQVQL